jgi:hypothetical protein
VTRKFEIRRMIEVPATPEQVWDAITAGTGGWLWPIEYEPRAGGTPSEGGVVTAWDPPWHLATRSEGENGWFNQLDFAIERSEGGAVLHYVHSGIFVADWDDQYDAADRHTDFYLHTLGQYLRWFTGRAPTYVAVQGPPTSRGPDAFEALRRGLGLDVQAAEGDAVHVEPPGAGSVDGVVDYLAPHFVGVRTREGLYRFFGRNAWGMPVAVAIHLFVPDVDPERTARAWSAWLDGLFA